jgi:hypothetical protein
VARLIGLYYWLTPVFWALDAIFGANVRAAAFEGHPGWKVLYYLFCFGCGVAIYLRPAWASLVGMTESAINILALIVGFLLPYFRLVEQLAAGETAVDGGGFTIEKSLSLLLSGLMAVLAFHTHSAQLPRRRGSA